MAENKSVEELIGNLQSTNSTLVFNALVTIRKNYVNKPDRMQRLEKYAVIKTIISFLEHPKLCNISLSIVANCCLDSCLRQIVLKNNGVKCLVRILKGLVNDDVKNRACRALGNIALCKDGAVAVHNENLISYIVKFLNCTDDVNCQQTAVRTLRILGDDVKKREVLVRENGILPIANLLHSKDKNVVLCCAKAIALLSKSCSIGCAMQLQESKALPTLVELYSHSDQSISKNAVTALENLARLSAIRPELVNVGAIQIFVKIASSAESEYENTESAVLALCYCCTDFVEREGIRKAEGLTTLLSILSDDRYERIHTRIVSALIPLCCERLDFDKFHDLELLQIVLKRLKKYVEVNKCDHSIKRQSEVQQKLDFEVEENSNSANIELEKKSYTFTNSEGEIENADTKRHHVSPKNLEQILKINTSEMKSPIFIDVSKTDNTVSNNETAIFSIHSPSYQGIQYSDTCVSTPVYSYDTGYSSFTSPMSITTNPASPDHYSFDWNPSSPVSCSSSIGPLSPASSSNEDRPVCWSPVLSSRPHSPDSTLASDDDAFGNKYLFHSTLGNIKQQKTSSDVDSNVKILMGNCEQFDTRNQESSFSAIHSVPYLCANKQPICPRKVAEVKNVDKIKEEITKCDHPSESSFMLLKYEKESESVKTLPKDCDYQLGNIDDCIEIDAKIVLEKCISIIERESNSSHNYTINNKASDDLLPQMQYSEKKLKSKKRKYTDHTFKINETDNCPTLELQSKHQKSVESPCCLKMDSGPLTKGENLIETQQSVTQSTEYQNHSSEKNVDHFILLLLSHISVKLEFCSDSVIMQKNYFGVLMDYLSQLPSPDPRAGKILMKLINNRFSFEKLIMYDFIGQIYERMGVPHDTELCRRCSNLENIKNKLLLSARIEAESEFGIGTLSHILLTGSPFAQLHGLYAVSQLVRVESGLYKLLIESDGLSILSEFLTIDNELTFKSAARSLAFISRSLVGKPETAGSEMMHPRLKLNYAKNSSSTNCKYKISDFDVTFVVDDGTEVSASRDILSENSVFFQALLDGHFIEKTQTVISLPAISKKGILAIFHFLHGCLKVEHRCPYLNEIPLETLLELLAESDRFLLLDFQGYVEKCLLNMLQTKVAAQMYMTAKKCNCIDLIMSILCFILSETKPDEDYFKCLQILISDLPDFLNDIALFIKNKFPGRQDKPLYKRRISSTFM